MGDYGTFRRHLWAVPFEVIMLGGAAATLAAGNWKHLAASLFTLGISFMPLLVERRFQIKIPAILQVMYVAFIFASMFSGEVLGVYGHIWIWDDITHFIAGLLAGLMVMCWLAIFARQKKRLHLPVLFEALTIFCIGAAMAVMWEIAEFASDQVFGTFSQGKDLEDTMMDLIYELAGGLIMVTLWVLHVKTKNVFVISWLLAHLQQLNSKS
jgi:hypothetical protein